MWTEGANEHPPTPLSAGWVMVKKEYEGEGRSYGASRGDGNGFGDGDGYGDKRRFGGDTKEVIRLRRY